MDVKESTELGYVSSKEFGSIPRPISRAKTHRNNVVSVETRTLLAWYFYFEVCIVITQTGTIFIYSWYLDKECYIVFLIRFIYLRVCLEIFQIFSLTRNLIVCLSYILVRNKWVNSVTRPLITFLGLWWLLHSSVLSPQVSVITSVVHSSFVYPVTNGFDVSSLYSQIIFSLCSMSLLFSDFS